MEDVSARVAELVSQGFVEGSRLAPEIRSLYPDWSPEDAGARNLRDYVERFVDGVGVVGRAGMDVVYGPSEAAPISTGSVTSRGTPLPSNGPKEATNLWRMWVSPNSPFAIAISRKDGTATGISRESSVDDASFRLEPASQAQHKAIANDFLKDTSGVTRNTLESVLDDGAGEWWRPWFKEVQSAGLAERWHQHRTTSLEALLKEALDDQMLPDQAATIAYSAIVSDRFIKQRVPFGRARPSNHLQMDTSDLVQIVTQAVNQMSVAELRDLRIPVGVVMDIVLRDQS